MPADDLERLCLAVIPGTGAVEIQPLATGLISETYRVVRNEVAYALKAAVKHGTDLSLDLGMHLGWEARVLDCAASSGLAPPLAYVDPKRAVLVSRWVAGHPWSPETAGSAKMRKIGELLRRVHALRIPASPRVMGPLSWVRLYGAALSRTGRSVESTLRASADLRLHEFAQLTPAVGVVCHSDLHRMNLLQDGEMLILLDWEYTHVCDPFWDLAGWAANNDFEAQSQRALLTSYLRTEPAEPEWLRLRLLMWLYDYVCLLWSELYLSARGGGADEIARRATLLDARLRVPANYAA
jgi:thiamine kinase-like enzyme